MKSKNEKNQSLGYLDIDFKGPQFFNLSSAQLVEHSIRNGEGSLSETGALVVSTGVHTGRSPKDKYIVDYSNPEDQEIAWGEVNSSISPLHFTKIYSKVKQYLVNIPLYIQDVIAGNHPEHKITIRIISEKAWASLFSRNLLIPVTIPPGAITDFTLIHVPGFFADPVTDGTRTGTFILLDFTTRIVLIGGTSYAGEIKKSVFTLLNRLIPRQDVLPMHCSANIGKSKDTALFFGLSGTGKTTLSSSNDRALIGDDEHGWCNTGIFNFEGGCYAKTIHLKKELEPLIWDATHRFGAVLENVTMDCDTRILDFSDSSVTENTRGAYPLNFIRGYIKSGQGDHPSNIFFLSADAFGVFPPISRLTPEQAVYYFLLGYTSKLAGTEKGLGKEPEATFSTCFGEPFLPLSPVVYAKLLEKRIREHNPQIWLINTGWTGGPYGVGSRIPLPYSRAMIRSALSNLQNQKGFFQDEIFKLSIPRTIDGVPSEILNPILTWSSKTDYFNTARSLVEKIRFQMKKFEKELDPGVIISGPG